MSSWSGGACRKAGWSGSTSSTGWCGPRPGSTAAVTPSWTAGRRWPQPRAWWPTRPSLLLVSLLTSRWTCGRWEKRHKRRPRCLASQLGVREEGDVRATGRSQRAIEEREDQFGDITGGQAGAKFGIGPAQHLRIDRSRAHADGADAMRPAFYGDRLGQADDPVLGDVVGGQPGELLGGVDARQRGDSDNPPFARRAHGRECRAAAQERAGQVDRQRQPDRLVPVLPRGIHAH